MNGVILLFYVDVCIVDYYWNVVVVAAVVDNKVVADIAVDIEDFDTVVAAWIVVVAGSIVPVVEDSEIVAFLVVLALAVVLDHHQLKFKKEYFTHLTLVRGL